MALLKNIEVVNLVANTILCSVLDEYFSKSVTIPITMIIILFKIGITTEITIAIISTLNSISLLFSIIVDNDCSSVVLLAIDTVLAIVLVVAVLLVAVLLVVVVLDELKCVKNLDDEDEGDIDD